MPPVSVAPGEYGPTRRNDTLWSIAEQVRPDTGVSVEQTMLALLRANPQAFIDNNINNLKEGYVLRVPSREDMTSVSRSEALREARAQYTAWRAAHNQLPVAQTGEGAATAGSGAGSQAGAGQAAAEPSLQLVAPEAGESAGGAAAGESLAEVQKDLMMANEALEEQRRKSEEMSGRLSMLEEQIAKMQRLIELKDNELARLQALGAGEPAGEATPDLSGENLAAQAPEDMSTAAGENTEALAPGAEMAPGEPVAEQPVEGSQEAPVAEDAAVADDTAMSADAGGMEGEALPEEGIPVPSAPADADATVAEMSPPQAVPAPAPVAEVPPAPDTATTPGFVERVLANPLWLGAGAVVLGLLGFLGWRRKRGVETDFQESILQAAHKEATVSDSEIVASQPESTESKAVESSLLSEFAVSDVGSIRNDGEADPLAEADVYLAYGRYQQAEDLIKDALEKDGAREDLNLKLLEVFMAAKNQPAFDEHAQVLLGQLENGSSHPLWEKVAEMGRELSPGNPMYEAGAAPVAERAEEDEGVPEDLDFSMPEADADDTVKSGEEGLDFNLDLSFDPSADANQPDSAEFVPPEVEAEPVTGVDMDSVEPRAATDDNSLDFDLEGFGAGELDAASAEEPQGDGELTDLDEVSTKLDLARAYIDMGDPDGAKSILDEVLEEGSENQKTEARDIMAQMS
jgi:pilus assembly protein FimV